MHRIAELLSIADKPLIVAGYGIRLAGEVKRFREFIERTRLPFVTTWGGADLVPTDHPQNLGIIGISGQRGANKAARDCDTLIALGTHLSLPQTSTLTNEFAPKAQIVVVDIDRDQLDHLTIAADLKIWAPLAEFFDYAAEWSPFKHLPEWAAHCAAFKLLSPPPLVGSYAFNDAMTRMLPPGTCMVIDGGGTALYTGFQSSYVKEGSRLICSMSMSAMGSGLPEAIGACFANDRKLTTCLIGDGSLMLNLQELQTIATHRLPIKIFVINNGGYLAIRQTQKAFQDGRYYGVGGADLEFPDVERLARVFDISYRCALSADVYERAAKLALEYDRPVLCEVFCPQDQKMVRQGYVDGKPMPLSEMVFA